MQRIPLRLTHVQAARELRAGKTPDSVRNKLGINKHKLDKIKSLYANIPDPVLASIERLLNDRDQLRHIIASLMPGTHA